MSDLLVRAVLLDEEPLVRALLEAGADANQRSGPLGRTALQLAARNDRADVAATLLDWGAEPNAVSLDSLTALHVAAANGSPAMVRLLLERGALPSPGARFNGKSPLYIAVERDGLQVARLLLRRGASVLDSTVGSTTLLHLAARSESLDVAKAVFKYAEHGELAAIVNVRENIEGKTALHMAVEREDLELCRLLLKHGAKADEPCGYGSTAWYPLTFSVERQNEKLTSLLLQHGACKSAAACLRHCLRYRYRRLAQLLLRSGAVVVDGDELLVAVDTGHADLVDLCLKHGATSSPKILRRAVLRGAAPIVELLLNAGAPVNQKLDKSGVRPLDLAAREHDVALARLLLRRGGVLKGEAPARDQAFIVRQLAVLEAEGVGMCPSNRRLVDGPWHGLLKCCRREIKLMRESKVGESAFTFYGLLVKEEDALAALARNDEFVAVFQQSNFRREFPQYADTLALNFSRGRLRCKLLEKSAVEIGGLTNGLPRESTYNVLRLLSNEELKVLGQTTCWGQTKLSQPAVRDLLK